MIQLCIKYPTVLNQIQLNQHVEMDKRQRSQSSSHMWESRALTLDLIVILSIQSIHYVFRIRSHLNVGNEVVFKVKVSSTISRFIKHDHEHIRSENSLLNPHATLHWLKFISNCDICSYVWYHKGCRHLNMTINGTNLSLEDHVPAKVYLNTIESSCPSNDQAP